MQTDVYYPEDWDSEEEFHNRYYPNPSPEERKAGRRLAKKLTRMKGQRPGTRWRYQARHNSIMKGEPTNRAHWETRKPKTFLRWGGFYSFEDAHSILTKGGDTL